MNACCETPAFKPPAASSPGSALKTVVLIGPPNSGKSTLFNKLTGLRQKVANYPGVTVEQRMGLMAGVGRDDLTLIDLPGIYSLTPYSEDARVAVDVLRGRMPGTPKPDAVLLVLDSLHLTRQLMLAMPVLAVGLPTLVLLNMTRPDGVARRPHRCAQAGARARRAGGADQRRQRHRPRRRSALSQPAERPRPDQTRRAAGHRQRGQHAQLGRAGQPPHRLPRSAFGRQHAQDRQRPAASRLGTAALSARRRRAFLKSSSRSASRSPTALAICSRAPPISSARCCPSGWLQSLLLDGVWKGICSVLVFLPQILLLFLFIGILEDTGYLARAALIADRVMRTIGLNGKAFIPLLSAYACAVPAIMATRTIENKRDRLATILVTPFMTCSARLPVYLLLIAAFIPNVYYLHGLLGLQTLVMLGLYLAGFVAAFTTARLLKSSILKSSDTPFILELPQYRMPTLYSLALRLIDRARIFMKNAGTIIVAVTLALWVLAHLPAHAHGHRLVHRAATCRQPHRPTRPLHRAGHRPARLQLEDRHRPALQRAGARGHGRAPWARSTAPTPAPRPSTCKPLSTTT